MKSILVFLGLILLTQPIFAKSYKEGYYYTKEGKKVEGLIKFRRASFGVFNSKESDILFKKGEDSASVKLTTKDISSFVTGDDSFAIVYNIKINSIQGEYKEDFAKVVITGRMNLFIHMSSSGDGKSFYDNDRYVISKDSKIYFGIWNAKKQRKEIAYFFSDDPDIQSKILNKEFDKKIPELVKEYNSKNS